MGKLSKYGITLLIFTVFIKILTGFNWFGCILLGCAAIGFYELVLDNLLSAEKMKALIKSRFEF